ncbi:Major Facilitator Superfamily protein [compost metagenome]
MVFVMLLTLGLFHGHMPLWLAVTVPSLFILFHSGGPGANGKSLSSLSFRSELRAGANGIIGALGSIGAALGLLVFPLFREKYGLEHTFLILSVVPLIASVICFVIRWDPTRTTINPDNEADAPQFKDDVHPTVESLRPAVGKMN